MPTDLPNGRNAHRGFTVWLTGLSGAGKSTLARASAEVLGRHGLSTEVLDGDEIRTVISRDLGFSKADREKNVRRISAIAQFLSENGTCVLVAAISPYRQLREEARNAHCAPFVEVYVDCPKDELFRRDTKGLYARARQVRSRISPAYPIPTRSPSRRISS